MVLVPMFLGFIFQIALVGLLASSLSLYRGYLQGILGALPGMVILFESLDFSQYADIPTAYFFLAATVILYSATRSREHEPPLSILTGLMVGAALWTKNEGWAFFVALLAGKLLVDGLQSKDWRRIVRWWGYFLLGVLPFLIAAVYFKLVLAPPNDLVGAQSLGEIKSKMVDLTRYSTIFKLGWKEISKFGHLIIPMVFLLPVYLLLVGVRLEKSERTSIGALLLIIFFWISCYFLIYLITPQRLAWHISNSANRLISQVLPSLLFITFISAKSLQEE